MNNDEPWVEFAEFCVQMENYLWMQGLLKTKGAELASEGSLWRPTDLSLTLLRVSTLSLQAFTYQCSAKVGAKISWMRLRSRVWEPQVRHDRRQGLCVSIACVLRFNAVSRHASAFKSGGTSNYTSGAEQEIQNWVGIRRVFWQLRLGISRKPHHHDST